MQAKEGRRRWPRWVAGVTLQAGRVLGWASACLFVLAFTVESSGILETWVERMLAARLGPATGEVRVRDVELEWTRRGVNLRGLSLGGTDLAIEHVHLRFGWRAQSGLRIERVEAEHGDLRLSRALITGLEALVAARDSDTTLELPEVLVRDLSIAVETPEWGDLQVGVLDAALVRDEEDRPRVAGRLVPAMGEGGRTGEIYLDGLLEEETWLTVRGAARDLPLTTSFLPEGPAFDPLRQLAPLALFDLEATARWDLGRDVLPTAKAQVRLVGGSLTLPWVEDPDGRRVRDVGVALEVSFDPGRPLALWNRDAWQAIGHASARWEDIEVAADLRIGREATDGRLAEAWLHVPALPIDERSLELGAHRPWLMDLWHALEPAGTIEIAYGIGVPRGWTPEDGFIDSTDRTVAILPGGKASASFAGWPSLETGKRNEGFPLPFDGITGRVHYVHRPGLKLAEMISVHGLEAHHGQDKVELRCTASFVPAWKKPPERRKEGPLRFHLLATTEAITVGDGRDLRVGLEGLAGLEGCEQLWTEYLPTDGKLGARVELYKDERHIEFASDVRVDFKDIAARWIEFPVPCDSVNGTLHVRTEGRGPAGRGATSLSLIGRSQAVRGQIRVEGRSEFGPAGPDAAYWQVQLEDLNLRSTRLREVLGQTDPRTLAGLESAGATGFADLTVTVARAGPGAPDRRWLEASARGEVQLVPPAFPMQARNAYGRVLATWNEPAAPDEPIQADLRMGVLGRLAAGKDGIPIWLAGRFPPQGPGRIQALGAGLDPLGANLVSALETALSKDEDEPVEIDLTSIDTRGRVDFSAAFELAPVTGEVQAGQVDAQARIEYLGFEGVELLRDLRGRVTWDQALEVWRGPLLQASLGRTPVTLRDVSFTQPESGGWELIAGLQATGLPIDREHLRLFLDARTMRTLLEDFDARGRFDVAGGTLRLAQAADGATTVHFEGRLQVRDLSMKLGVPIEVRSAEEVDVDLRIEDGRVRALARVGRFFGQVAGRRLNDARLQLTYIEPRLTLEALDGEFEGGRLRSLEGLGGSTFFAIDLGPPFPFVLSGRMHQVEVGRLLRGVFNSDFANEGRFDTTLQLRGDLEHLTAIEGGGEFDLSDSSLWAIPVFQAVFSRLGLESTATFSRMGGHYTIDGGRVTFPELRLTSDLLSLVGHGTIDFTGALNHDLEVRYALVDQLGPLTRLLYFIQNSLLRISVRGDMSRPEVVVKGLFSQFFGAPVGGRRLPLPGYAELPSRF
jgi:AsmA-like C-terminal region